MTESCGDDALAGSDKRVVLVTGAARGIGAAIAIRIAQDGHHVIVNYRQSREHAERVAATIRGDGGSADIQQADLTNLTDTREMVRRIKTNHGRLNALVNNAGFSTDGLFLLTKDQDWWNTFRGNVACTVNTTRAALPLLLADRSSAIVNISSVSGIRGVEGQTAYGAAKAALIGFTKALARELAGKASVNCIAPGPIDTGMYRQLSERNVAARLALIPVGRLGAASEVAEVVALLLSGRAMFIHGQVISIDGGVSM